MLTSIKNSTTGMEGSFDLQNLRGMRESHRHCLPELIFLDYVLGGGKQCFTLLEIRNRICNDLDFILTNFCDLHGTLSFWFQSLLCDLLLVIANIVK